MTIVLRLHQAQNTDQACCTHVHQRATVAFVGALCSAQDTCYDRKLYQIRSLVVHRLSMSLIKLRKPALQAQAHTPSAVRR